MNANIVTYDPLCAKDADNDDEYNGNLFTQVLVKPEVEGLGKIP